MDKVRQDIHRACVQSAALRPGFFSLTVPTGGGKTLASLDFALRHACTHGHRRIIYAIPFTSIIDQNAGIFRKVFHSLAEAWGHDPVLEHHSNFDAPSEPSGNEVPLWRKAAENWDAPLIATTNVQFFESLYANRPSRCRKLHRIARSVIILDEAQAIPVFLIHPILHALECLVKDFGCTVVFCTATQPALQQRDDFPIGIPAADIIEIAPAPAALQTQLRRVTAEPLGPLTHAALYEHLRTHAQTGALVIFNTTRAAASFYHLHGSELLKFHLSARMCPAHRRAVLSKVADLRRSGQSCLLVSTQVVEAGVDLSFPVVYRAECGIDSLTQAAGRCNRHGEWGLGPDAQGRIYLFEAVDHPLPSPLAELQRAAGISKSQIIGKFPDPLSLEAIEAFFQQSIWLQGGHAGKGWDKNGVLDCFPNGDSAQALLTMNFASAADAFQMIPTATKALLIPWDAEGEALAAELRQRERTGIPPSLTLYRQAQQYSVHVYPHEWPDMLKKSESLHEGAFVVLTQANQHYDPDTGLKPGGNPAFLYV